MAMAHVMGVQVVAVRVESDEQLQSFSRAVWDYAQGFLFFRPLSQDVFEALLSPDRQQEAS
ncbi:hypothetical protein [Marinobacter vulgaris]|uniref:hypothetical protein n=1 Tax=Marinobacter vulgaris TaxID=1928331 RepID=UPI001D0DAF1F|nr:hypothetical protein [Marinobacter vulgaris]